MFKVATPSSLHDEVKHQKHTKFFEHCVRVQDSHRSRRPVAMGCGVSVTNKEGACDAMRIREYQEVAEKECCNRGQLSTWLLQLANDSVGRGLPRRVVIEPAVNGSYGRDCCDWLQT